MVYNLSNPFVSFFLEDANPTSVLEYHASYPRKIAPKFPKKKASKPNIIGGRVSALTSLSSQSTSMPLRLVQALELTPAVQAKLDARQPSTTDAKFGMDQVMQLQSDGDELQPPLYAYNDGQRKTPGDVSIKNHFLQ